MNPKKFKTVFTILAFSFLSILKANNLQVSNVSLLNKNTVDNYLYIQFDVSWENSWRINTGAQNWDAAWIFIKFRVDGGAWRHASLSNLDNEHTVPTGATADASNDGKGVFLYRSANGSGNISWPAVQLKWLYGLDGVTDNATNVEVRVFGIEMVYVNEGPFYVGDSLSVGRLYDASDVTEVQPAFISNDPVVIKASTADLVVQLQSDSRLASDGIYVDGDNGIDTIGGTSINNPDYPTGYKAFYCMKYEITQKQYVDFLNTLTRLQQDKCTHRNRGIDIDEIEGNPFLMSNLRPDPDWININDTVETRNGIYGVNTEGDETSPITFYCNADTTGTNRGQLNQDTDGQWVACNLLGWLHGTSFADWAALRPMTELEFEKACRGPETPVENEFAWHTDSVFGSLSEEYTFSNFGTATEIPLNISTTDGNAAYEYTTGHKWTETTDNITHPTRIDGPVRVGLFATSTSNRITSGASYYGIMELSGNANERCVSLGNGRGRKFMGTHGDGNLIGGTGDDAGNATNSDWPGIDLNRESTSNNDLVWNGSGYRGGDWNDGISGLKVSSRRFASLDPFGPNIGSGFRCVRTED